ncbi:MAG: PAS domain-containing sensor histidine kinase, partial [Terriglobales bacterium]
IFDLFSGFVTITQTVAGARWTPLGPHSAALGALAGASLCLLSIAWLAAAPRLRPVSFCHEATSAGWLMRHVLPLVLVFPLRLTWLRSYEAHPLESKVVALVLVGGSFFFFLTLLWKSADVLDGGDRRRLERQAYASEISDLYDHAPCGYYSLDPGGRIIRINETALGWLGYRRSDILNRVLFADLLTPASRVAFLRHFPKVLQSNAVQTVELALRREDGTLLPAAISDSGVFDREGRFLHTRSTLFDVTQRRQAEAALRKSEARNRAILASAADAIVTLEESGVIEDFNPAAELMFGLRRGEAVNLRGTELLAADSPLHVRPLASLAVELEIPRARRLEFSARRSDGTIFPAELTLTRVAGQSPGLFTAFIRDVTERKRAEAELRDSEERLRLLLDSTGEGIYALDLMGSCILCNPAALRLLGYGDASELLGRPIHMLIHHTRVDGTAYPAHECRSFLAARQGQGVEVDDELFFRKDGTGFPVEYRSYPVERNGQPVGLVVTFTDITTRRGLETQIRQAQKMEAIGRLAAGIAHDFNNLLTVINGYSDLLLETDPEPGMREKLRSVRAAGDRAATLTHQLLAFSRQQVLQPRMLDLNAVVGDLEPLLQRTIGEDIELSCQLAADLPPVKADPSQLDQILMNLVVNARDAMPEGGDVRIATSAYAIDNLGANTPAGLLPGRFVTLSVSDTGTGMAPETQAHIFEPFFTTKPQGKGTGLGLPTVFG